MGPPENITADFCLLSPARKIIGGRGEFPFSPGVDVQTPPTPNTSGNARRFLVC